MKLIKEVFSKNPLLAKMGLFFLILAVCLGLYATVNTETILGINSMIKPLKFALSTWIYAWTMAYLLFYVNDQSRVKRYSILAMVVMLYENGVITIQAFRGKLSHFNQTELVGDILYSIMGILIVWLTTATLVISIRFIFQKTDSISKPFALSIKIGLILFVIFSFMGGYMSVINSHNVGGKIGESGLTFLNWSTLFGDLRVAHFFGIHSLQVIPLLGFYVSTNIKNESKASLMIWLGSIIYLGFVCFTMIQAINETPFI
jgi:hypothetical protein